MKAEDYLMDRVRLVFIAGLSLVGMCSWIEAPCGSENLLTISPGSTIESFEIRDHAGSVVWHIEAAQPRSLVSLNLGAIPSGFVQKIPVIGKPRDFAEGETLTMYTVARDHTFLHTGQATGPRSFCGGFYESTEINSEAAPN